MASRRRHYGLSVGLNRTGIETMRSLIAALALAVALPAAAEEKPLARGDVETIVREYLLANPEILFEVQEAYEAKQKRERDEAAKLALAERRDQVFSSPHQTEIGNPDADVTVVEFFDYNCSYCARALDDMDALLAADPNLKFVLKEVPIIRPESVGAHRVSLAVFKLAPGKYADFHRRLFAVPGVKTDRAALEVAEALGLERDAVMQAANDDTITDAFREATQLAEALGITGTPSYVVGDELIFGALGADVLREKIAAVRECGKTSCT